MKILIFRGEKAFLDMDKLWITILKWLVVSFIALVLFLMIKKQGDIFGTI